MNAGNGASNSSVSADTSLNWAGYVASSGTFTSVSAAWTIPHATSTNNNLSADATWVGIGGISSHDDLIQAGTQTIIQNGIPTYQAWYELLPVASVQVLLTIHPGDAMIVSLVEQPNNQWRISFNNATTGQNYQTLVFYNSSLSSAEWIEEMPSDQMGFVPLDNFGTISFSNGFAVQNGLDISISGSGAQPITMITNASQVLAAPTSIGSDGASFTVTRSSVTIPATPTIIRRGRWSRTGIGVQGYAPLPQTSRSNGHFSLGSPASFLRNFGNNMRNFNNNARTEFQSLRKLNLQNR